MKNIAHTVLEFALNNLRDANSQIFTVEKELDEGCAERHALYLTRVEIGKAITRLMADMNEIGDKWRME